MISRDGANRWVGGRSLQFSVILLGKNPKGALVVDHRSCDFGPILEPHWPKWPWTNQGRMFLMRRRLHAGPNISTWAEQRPSTDQLQFTHIPDSSDKSLKFRTPFNKKKTKTYTSKFFHSSRESRTLVGYYFGEVRDLSCEDFQVKKLKFSSFT